MAAVGLVLSNSGATLLAMALSPPSTRSVWLWMVQFWRASSSGRTCSSHMAFISRGTPGIRAAQWPWASSNQAPGAVPWSLMILRPFVGTMACLRLFSVGRRFVRAKKARILSHSVSSKCSVSPKTSATVSLVRSSSVGPKPPEKMSRSLRLLAWVTSSRRRAGLSPMTCWCSTLMPSSASSRLKNCALVFKMSPSSSSVPTQMISAVTADHPLLHPYGCKFSRHFQQLPLPAPAGRAYPPQPPKFPPWWGWSWGAAG